MAKTSEIKARMRVLENHFKKSANQLGKDSGLGNATVDDWNDNQLGNPTLHCKAFLKHYNIDLNWWETGNGEIFNTSVQKQPTVTEKDMGEIEAFKRLVEGGTEYLLVPRTAFEGAYRFVPVEQIANQTKEIEIKAQELARKDAQIQSLTNAVTIVIQGIASGRFPQASEIKETQKNTPV